jgi:NAD(P)H-dependent flavin oxidoreductase YrpB (nitropropane dioxygenase family)
VEGELEIGQVSSLITSIPTVKEVMESIIAEFNEGAGKLKDLSL